METYDEPGQRRLVSIPSLIAWLSLCILAAAWGRSLDERWQAIWADVGAYGLVAAVALGLLERARLAHQKWARGQALQARTEFGLARLSEQGAARDAINCAIRRLYAAAASQADGQGVHSKRSQRDEVSRALGRLPLEITPVVDGSDASCELAESIDGSLRTLSARGLAFAHSQPFVSRIAVLTFELGQGHRLCVVVDVLGSEATADGFISRGTVLDVGVPAAKEMAAREPGSQEAKFKQPADKHHDSADVDVEACTV